MLRDVKLVTALFTSFEIEAAKSKHPNELKFKGVLVKLDEPSTKPPNGSRGHKILIPKTLAQAKVSTLIGMGVNYSDNLDSHKPTNKVGVIQSAKVVGNEIIVEGIIWKKDFPDAEKVLKKKDMGMSFEASDIDVEDVDASIWRLSDLCFTGAAILYKASAAYFKTEALAASAMSAQLFTTNNGGVDMAQKKVTKKKPSVAASGLTPDSLVAAMTKVMAPIQASIDRQSSSILNLQHTIMATNAERIAASAADLELEADGDEDEEEEGIEAGGDDDEDEDVTDELEAEGTDDQAVQAKGKKIVKKDAEEEEDDMESEADDEDELEDEGSENFSEEDDNIPGHMNKNSKNKGDKTTVSTTGDKHKTASDGKVLAAIEKLTNTVTTLKASHDKLARENKTLRRKVKQQDVAIAAAGEGAGRRRSMGSAQLQNLLSKGGVDGASIQASGEKMSVEEFDQLFKATPGISIVQRVALKSEAARIGVLDEGHVHRVQ